MANVIQRNLAGGELAPALYGRTDQVKYATGLRTCRNAFVLRSGGVANRPGTRFVARVKDSATAVRLVPFIFSDAETYVLELGDRSLRLHWQGAPVTVSGVAAWVTATAYAVGALVTSGGTTYVCTTAHTAGATTEPGTGTTWATVWYALAGSVYEIPTPYLAADLAALQVVQSGDVLTIVHPSYAPRELARHGHTDWRLTAIAFGPRISPPTGLGVTGGVAGDIRYWAVTAIDATTHEESLVAVVSATGVVPEAATPTVLTWTAPANAASFNVYRSTDGVTFGLIATTGGTPLAASASSWTDATETASTSTPGAWVPAAGAVSIAVVASAADKAFDGVYTITGTITLEATGGTSPTTNSRVAAYYRRGGEARVFAGHLPAADQYLTGTGTLGPLDVVSAITVPDNGYSTLTLEFVPEVFGGGSPAGVTLFEATFAGTSVAWGKGGASYSDVGDAPDYAVAPPAQRALFDQAGKYPSTVSYYQQRRCFAHTTAEPETVWASRTGAHANFTRSTPLADDDPVLFTLAGRKVRAVRHLLDLGRLIVFTASSEHVIEGDQAGILRPDAVNPRQVSEHGAAATLPPLVVGTSALFVQARGTIVRDLMADAIEGHKGNDLTVFASHLFAGHTIVDWAYQQVPHSIVWAVRDDGVLLSLTYLREHAIWGWSRHDTAGAVEQVCTIPEGAEDAVYLVVRRTLSGAPVRTVERMATRQVEDIVDAVFVDCALSYDGRNTGATTLTLTGGTAWTHEEDLTLTASAATFGAETGNRFDLTAADGSRVRCTVASVTSATVCTVRADRTVPAALRGVAVPTWARAVETFAGLDHLEGCAVSVLGDGYVVASPHNDAYDPLIVTGGQVVLPEPRAVVHIGLPYLTDLETLDIDSAAGASLKDRKMLVGQVGLMVEAARGIFAGPSAPADDADALAGLSEYRSRDAETDPDAPPALVTDAVTITIPNGWSSGGRVCVRQVDPLPLTVLAVIPQGFLPTA